MAHLESGISIWTHGYFQMVPTVFFDWAVVHLVARGPIGNPMGHLFSYWNIWTVHLAGQFQLIQPFRTLEWLKNVKPSCSSYLTDINELALGQF